MKLRRPPAWRGHLPAFAIFLALAGCDVNDELTELEFDAEESELQLPQCFNGSLSLSAEFADGAVEDVTQRAEWTSSDPDAVRVSNGEDTSPSGRTLPKGTLSAVGESGDTATITATYAGRSRSMDATVQAARIEMSQPQPVIAEGTRVSLNPTLLLGDPAEENRFAAGDLVTLTVRGRGNGDEESGLLDIDEDGVAIAVDNDRPAGASIPLTVTASTDVFNADETGPCESGNFSVPLTVRNETIESLEIVGLATEEAPPGVSQSLGVIGNFTGGHTQSLTDLATLSTGNSDIARFGERGATTVTTQPGAEGQSTAVQATFDQGLGADTVRSTNVTLTVVDESLEAMDVVPVDPTRSLANVVDFDPDNEPFNGFMLPGTPLRFAAVGAFFNEAENTVRLLNITQDVEWSLTDTASGEAPDAERAQISNEAGSEGVVRAGDDPPGPLQVTAQRMDPSAAGGTEGDIVDEDATGLRFDARLTSLRFARVDQGVIEVDQAIQLIAVGTLSSGNAQDLTTEVTWAPDDRNAATVSDSPFTPGRLVGRETGSSRISARFDGETERRDVLVEPASAPPDDPDDEPDDPDEDVCAGVPLPIDPPLDCLSF